MTPSNLQLQTQLCFCATWANDWLVLEFLWIRKSQVSWTDVTHPAMADVLHLSTSCPRTLRPQLHKTPDLHTEFKRITWFFWIQRISKLPPVKVLETSCMYLQYIDNNFNILEVICLLWMCTPNVCQPFFLIRLSGLSSQCVQLKEKHLIVHLKTDSLQTIPYFPRLSEHACRLNPDA